MNADQPTEGVVSFAAVPAVLPMKSPPARIASSPTNRRRPGGRTVAPRRCPVHLTLTSKIDIRTTLT
jgi:hypothetical protein